MSDTSDGRTADVWKSIAEDRKKERDEARAEVDKAKDALRVVVALIDHALVGVQKAHAHLVAVIGSPNMLEPADLERVVRARLLLEELDPMLAASAPSAKVP